MGVAGLLQALKSIQKPTNLKQFKGQTLGIDAYGWLHRGCTACAVDLALGNPTTKYVDFAMNRVRMLLHFGVTPYLVFDGANLPSKSGTDDQRNSSRADNKRQGLEYLRLGRKDLAFQTLQKAVDVTPEMAGMLIRELNRNGVKYVVAPYEADAQLFYLERKGLINGILSEDSDLLVFGARCLLTKLDQYGACVMIRRDDFTSCREMSLIGWSDVEFRRMAILSGCDYLDSIAGIGLKTSYRLVRRHKTVERVLQSLRLEGKKQIPSDYLQRFNQADLTFLYQWVYCPISKAMVNVTTPTATANVIEMSFIGHFYDATTAKGVAEGRLHPTTKKLLKTLPEKSLYNTSKLAPTAMASRDQENVLPKKGVSIEQYFKPKRQPLAELDVNSFIMTPHQQELARNASNTTWSSPFAPNSTPITPQPRSQSTSVPRIPRPATTGFRQPRNAKRSRLCQDDGDVLPLSTKKPITTSKFFSGGSSNQKRQKATSEFDIHSDDFFDAAFEALADTSTPLSRNQLKIQSSNNKVPMVDQIVDQIVDDDESQLTLVDSNEKLGPPIGFNEDEETFVEEPTPCSNSNQVFLPSLKEQKLAVDQSNQIDHSDDLPDARIVCTSSMFPKTTHLGGKSDRSKTTRVETNILIVESDCEVSSAKTNKVSKASSEIAVQGSEDLVISDSESEDDIQQKKRLAKLNLSRFAYTC